MTTGIAKIIGILLIAAGALGLIYGGFTYTKQTHSAKLTNDTARLLVMQGFFFNLRIDHGGNSEAAAGKSAPPNRRQGTRGIAC